MHPGRFRGVVAGVARVAGVVAGVARVAGVVVGNARVAPAPGSFAAVMATGIVSITASEHGYPALSVVLAALAVAGLVVITGLIAARAAAGVAPVSGSLRDPAAVLPLFGAVAACAVLGARFAAERSAVMVLGALGLIAWLVLLPTAVRVLRQRALSELRGRARGAWLLPAVATAGLAITAADLTVRGRALLVTALAGWVLSLGLYAGALALIGVRALATGTAGELLAGDSWVIMGALAICTLAADRILSAATRAHATGWVDGWLRPASLACWALASTLAAALGAAHAREQLRRTGVPRHNVFWWAAVFPLGMYSVATLATAHRFHLHALSDISTVFCWIALLAWLFAAVGVLHAGVRHASARRKSGPPDGR